MVKEMTQCFISNKNQTFKELVDFLIVPKITGMIPSSPMDISKIKLPTNIELADPSFHKPEKIDALLSAEYFFKIFTENSFSINENLSFRESVFGWVASGTLEKDQKSYSASCCFLNDEELDCSLQRFWDLESIGVEPVDPKHLEEDQASELFHKSVQIVDGRYEVALPWKEGNLDCHQ